MTNIELEAIFTEKNIDHNYLNKHLVQKKVCMQKDIGIHGNLFGGNLLSWIDESAAGFISEAIGHRPVVTVNIGEVTFKEPVKVNDVINIDCTIITIGNSSIKVLAEVINTRTLKQVCWCMLNFVHVNPNTMKSMPI